MSAAQLEVVSGERNSLKEDLRSTREAKRLADQSYRVQNAKLQKLESELAFYQKEAATAVSDRDRVHAHTRLLDSTLLQTHACLPAAQSRQPGQQSRGHAAGCSLQLSHHHTLPISGQHQLNKQALFLH